MNRLSPVHKINVCHIIAKMVYGGASIGTLHLVEKLDSKLFACTIIHGFQSENEGRLLADGRRKNLNFITLPSLVREINLIKDFLTFLRLVAILKKHRYKIVHTHGSKAGVIGRIAAGVARTPVILHTVHGWGLKAGNSFAQMFFRFIEKIIATFTTKLLFQTEADMKEAELYKIGEAAKYYFIGNGINLRSFLHYDQHSVEHARLKFNPGGRRVIGTIGRVSAQKNPEGFVKIAQGVLQKRKDVIFLFVGGGELLEQMREKIRVLNLSDYIVFTGVVEDIPPLLAIFDIFILPSLWEGLPRSLLEGMAMAKPVVAHKVSGIDEIINNGFNGITVAINRYDLFVDAINNLLEDNDLCKKFGTAARKTALNYDYENVIDRTINLYLNLADD